MQACVTSVLTVIALLVSLTLSCSAWGQALSPRRATAERGESGPVGSYVMTGRLERREDRYALVDEQGELEAYLIPRESLDMGSFEGETVAVSVREPILRIVLLTIIFVVATRVGLWLVNNSATFLAGRGATVATQVAVVGLAGLAAMAGSIFVGVYLGAQVGIGRDARQQRSFVWWVINRLLFLAAVGSIQGFALYYLRDVLLLPDAERWTGILLAVVAVFLVASALGGGYLADRIGRRRLVMVSALVAAAGTLFLLVARDMSLVLVGGSILGAGAGAFMATNWALGTDLVPPQEAGRYLGISNLAGAGAGIVGAGIGGPMADFFNRLEPGLGYLVIFAIYGGLFLMSVLALTRVKVPALAPGGRPA